MNRMNWLTELNEDELPVVYAVALYDTAMTTAKLTRGGIKKVKFMAHLDDKKVRFLEETSNHVRQSIIVALEAAGSGHTAGALGMADIFAALYFRVLKHDPKNPDWPQRDRLVLSNGHTVPVRYAAMAHAGAMAR